MIDQILQGVPHRVHHHAPFLTESDWRNSEFPETQSLKTWAGVLPDGRLLLAGTAGLAKLSFGDLGRAVGVSRSKIRPASPDDLARVGMQPGGVNPVAVGEDVLVVLDSALPDTGVVFCGGGSAETTLEIDLADLLRVLPRVQRAAITA